jgi:cell shape-determining protein MreC
MTTPDRDKQGTWLTSQAGALGCALLLAVVLMLLPLRWSVAMKGYVAVVLRPGQVALLDLREQGRRLLAQLESHFETAGRLVEAEQERERLAQENRRLKAELAAARCRVSEAAGDSDDEARHRLLTARCVRARVLGQQARMFLGRHHLLDVGARSGVRPDALVVETPLELIDQGAGAGLQAGQLVLDRSRVWGKVVEVGAYTSTVRAVTEPGFRDLVELGPAGPQGILEGTGKPLARIRLIEVTEPVAAGDPVYSTSGKGFLTEPALYGWIVRVERPAGAAHWEVWMQPAVDPNRLKQVAVLKVEPNPLRLAARQQPAAGVER